jgi:phosphoribosyl 1,2-cyclic phosphate phosphodiesterase
MRQGCAMPVYASTETISVLQRVFSYAFVEPGPGITVPQVDLHAVDGPFELLGMQWRPVPAKHGEMLVLGFRVGRLAYLTDFSSLPEESKPLLSDLDDLMLDALRDIPHPMHQTVQQALDLISELRPRRAWFTHIAHDLPHEETNQRLAREGYSNVQMSYDGLKFEVRV